MPVHRTTDGIDLVYRSLGAGIAHKLMSSIPDCRVVELPGQGHLAIRFAPELVVREILKFLLA